MTKTIGDAVMAVFCEPEQALEAAKLQSLADCTAPSVRYRLVGSQPPTKAMAVSHSHMSVMSTTVTVNARARGPSLLWLSLT